MKDAMNELAARHPRLFRNGPPGNSWLPSGWLDLADRLCTDLTATLEIAAALERFEPLQVKEKLSEFRFYFQLAGDDGEEAKHALHADLFGVGTGSGQHQGDVHVEPTAGGVHLAIVPDDQLSQMLYDLVDEATKESRGICMSCGAPGRVRVRGGGYFLIACDKHRRGTVLPETWHRRREAAAAAKKKKKKKGKGDGD